MALNLLTYASLLFVGNVDPEEPSAPEPLRLAVAAQEAAVANLVSGKGSGRYVKRLFNPSRKRVEESAGTITVQFDRDRFRIDLDFEQHPSLDRRTVIIRDPSGLFWVQYSDRIRPLEVEVELFSPTGLSATGFRFDPTFYSSRIVNVGAFVKNATAPITVERSADGEFVASVSHERDSTSQIHFGVKTGLNVYSWVALQQGMNEPHQTLESTWERAQNVWYVMSVKSRINFPEWWVSEELVYETFEPNVQISPEAFTLKSLNLPGGVRILDRAAEDKRPEGSERIYRVVSQDDTDVEKLDSVVAEVQALPSQSEYVEEPVTPPSHAAARGSKTNIWLVAGNVIGLALIAGGLWWRRQRTRRAA